MTPELYHEPLKGSDLQHGHFADMPPSSDLKLLVLPLHTLQVKDLILESIIQEHHYSMRLAGPGLDLGQTGHL